MYKQNVYINGHPLNNDLMRLGDTDAMWRIYSQDKKSVQIKTTFEKIMKVMDKTRGMTIIKNNKILYTFVPYFGRVIYKPQVEIEKLIKDASGLNPFEYYKQCGDSLFVKRQEFEHENEIRFVIIKSNFNAAINDIGKLEDAIFMDVEPMDFIDEIKIDPRADDDLYIEIKQSIDSVFPGLSIIKSHLYAFNSNTIELTNTPLKIN